MCILPGTMLPFPVVDVLAEVVPCTIHCVHTYRSTCMYYRVPGTGFKSIAQFTRPVTFSQIAFLFKSFQYSNSNIAFYIIKVLGKITPLSIEVLLMQYNIVHTVHVKVRCHENCIVWV